MKLHFLPRGAGKASVYDGNHFELGSPDRHH
jgi:hypothetical protein